jgi:NAD(P)-dependent dehydrogenase (short-subunit alcohol dehydrogenase family)
LAGIGSRKAVVTGGARGIGRAAVERLLREGVGVVAVDLDEAGLETAASAGADTLVADVGEPAGRELVVEASAGADYLVNAAGIIRLKPIFEFTVDDWRDILRINAESVFFLCQQIGPRLRDGGAIVNLSSSSAKLATTVEASVYAVSKTAILSVTRSFAYALAPRVRVNAICPGIVDTPMQDLVLDEVAVIRGVAREELERARTRTVPLGRASSVEECAALVWFLLSDEAAYMTGQAINWTGGMVTW